MRILRLSLQILLPLAVLAGGGALARLILSRAKQPVVAPPPARGPLVRTAIAERADVRIDIDTQGTV